MSRDTRNYGGEYEERDSDGRAGPPRGRRSNGGRGPSDPTMRRQNSDGNGPPARQPYGASGVGSRGGGSRGGGRPPVSDPRGYGDPDRSDYPDQPSRRSRAENRDGPPPGSTRARGRAPADDSFEMSRAPGKTRRGLGDMARDMSRQLSAMVRGTGRAMQREAAQIAAAGERRPMTPMSPEALAQVQADLPRYRRSRIRMRARKWRLGRVRANPVAYSMGIASLVISAVSIVGGGGAGGVYAYNYYDVHRPAIQSIINNAIAGQNTIIYDRTGEILYTVRSDSGFNYYVPLSQMGKTIQNATLDTEDHSFYSPTNIGIDFQGTLRAAIADVAGGGTAQQGGSTITQQLVKRLILHDPSKKLQRKLNEIILAVGLNSNYSKAQILEMYLNTIDYGNQNQGIEAAARNFFGLEVKDGPKDTRIMANQQLSLAQAALLAGLPNNPTYYLPTQFSCDKAPCETSKWANPCVNDPNDGVCTPSGAYDWQKDGHEWLVWRRARVVLGSMKTYGDISDSQYLDGLKQVQNILVNHEIKQWAGLANGSVVDTTKRAPSFVDYITQTVLPEQFGIDPDSLATAGWRIYTTLDYKMNAYVEQNIDYYINKNHTVPTPTYHNTKWNCGPTCDLPLTQTANAHDGAAVAIDPYTGDVLAMVGSAKYGDMNPLVGGYYNVVTSPRSLGSSMKGIVYATAFQMGWTPSIMMQDSPICMPGSSRYQDNDPLVPGCQNQVTYVPHNYPGDGYNGYVPIRMALANSLNIPAVEAMSFVGDTPELSANFIDMARRLGISDAQRDANGKIAVDASGNPRHTGLTPEYMGPTTALGTQAIPLIELTNAYAAMANSGKHTPYRAILRIEDSAGNTWTAPTPKPAQVISPQAAYMLTSILSDDKARAPGFNTLNPLMFPQHTGIQVASKTGTGSGKNGPSDIVTIGYSPYLAVGVWVGNANNADMTAGIIGIAGAGYVFHDVMEWAIDNYKWPEQSAFPIPSGMAMGAFGCHAGLAPYQGEAQASSGGSGNTGGNGTSSTANVPKCVYRDEIASAYHLPIYGAEPGAPTPNIDWYIEGQQPLNS
jgi:membrane peptidoglycan carboxypeptidase